MSFPCCCNTTFACDDGVTCAVCAGSRACCRYYVDVSGIAERAAPLCGDCDTLNGIYFLNSPSANTCILSYSRQKICTEPPVWYGEVGMQFKDDGAGNVRMSICVSNTTPAPVGATRFCAEKILAAPADICSFQTTLATASTDDAGIHLCDFTNMAVNVISSGCTTTPP